MLERLQRLARAPQRSIVGLMSGTSLDGIDAALVDVEGAGLETVVRRVQFACTPFDAPLRQRLLRAASGDPLPSAEHARLHFEIAEAFAAAALAVVRDAGRE